MRKSAYIHNREKRGETCFLRMEAGCLAALCGGSGELDEAALWEIIDLGVELTEDFEMLAELYG